MASRKANNDDKQETARLKALDAAVQDLTRRFGDGSIIRLGEATGLTVDVIPTGSLGLDIALGVGGLPRGRVVEIYGPESSGKTTLCLHVIAEAQRLGGLAAFIDMEHALDAIYAERLGVDVDKLYISQPDTGEQAAGDHGGAGAFRRARRGGGRQRGGAGAPRGDRGRDG